MYVKRQKRVCEVCTGEITRSTRTTVCGKCVRAKEATERAAKHKRCEFCKKGIIKSDHVTVCGACDRAMEHAERLAKQERDDRHGEKYKCITCATPLPESRRRKCDECRPLAEGAHVYNPEFEINDSDVNYLYC